MVRTMGLKPSNDESGLATAQITVAEVTAIHLDPVPAKAPGVIVFEPETSKEEHIYYKYRDATAGTVSGLIRDYTNLNGGVGQQHEAQSAWETFQSSEYIENLVDMIQEGFFEEFNPVTYVNASTFTMTTDRRYYYSANRALRFNADDTKIGIVASSSYSGGTGLTTVIISYGTVPTPLTHVELAIQPNAAMTQQVTGSSIQTGGINYAADAGATDAYAVTLSPIPSSYTAGMVVNFKANTINTGAATLNVNALGAKTIKKNYISDLADGDILANQLVSVIYDGTNFQLLSPTSSRKTKRVESQATTDTITPEISTYDIFIRTAQAQALVINNHSTSTPADGDMMEFIILGDATPRAITYGNMYVAKSGTVLPSTTAANKCTKLLFQWRASLTQWDLVWAGQEA